MGKTIILSSHILADLAEICNRIGILERGQLVAQGTIDEVITSSGEKGEIRIRTTDDARACVLLRELSAVKTAEHHEAVQEISVHLATEIDLADLSGHLSGRGVHLRKMERREPTLEQVFMKLTEVAEQTA